MLHKYDYTTKTFVLQVICFCFKRNRKALSGKKKKNAPATIDRKSVFKCTS